MGIFVKQIMPKLALSHSRISDILYEMQLKGYVYFIREMGWRTTQLGRDEHKRLKSLFGVDDMASAKPFEEAIFEILGDRTMTAPEIAAEYYGSSTLTGPVRRAMFVMMENGRVERVGPPKDDKYRAIHK